MASRNLLLGDPVDRGKGSDTILELGVESNSTLQTKIVRFVEEIITLQATFVNLSLIRYQSLLHNPLDHLLSSL
jgi:hypothetical protein